MRLEYSKTFLKDVSRLNPNQADQLRHRLGLFQKQPTHPTLNNHRLKGKLKGVCSINISGDLRALYRLEKSDRDLTVKFIRLETHNQMYH